MKKLLSVLLTVLMLAIPVLGAAEETPAPTIFDRLWEVYDWSILTDWGVLTQDEVRLLTAEKDAVAAGRELVSTMKLTAEGMTGDPAADAAIAELLEALTVTARVQQDEAAAVVSLSGQDVLSVGFGEKDGAAYLASSLLESPVTVAAEEFDALLLRLVNAAQAGGYIDGQQAMELGYQLGMYPMSAMVSAAPLSWTMATEIDPSALDLTAWNEVLDPILARMVVTPVTEQPADCDEAAECWTVDITEEELNAFLVAGLKVVRDNPELCEMLDDALAMDGNLAEQIDQLILSAQTSSLFDHSMLRLYGWTDAAGGLTRLEVYVLDTDVDEEAVQAEFAEAGADDAKWTEYFSDGAELKKVTTTITHTRLTTDGVTAWKTMTGDAYTGLIFTLTEGAGTWSVSVAYMSGGVKFEETTLAAAYELTRADGTTHLSANASLSVYDNFGAHFSEEYEAEYSQPLTVALDAQITTDGYRIDATVQLADMNEAGETLTVTLASNYAVDGLDITGTDCAAAQIGSRRVTATVQTRAQEPQTSVFDEEALHLSALTDAELTAWLTGVVERAQTALTDTLTLLPEGIRDALESYGE